MFRISENLENPCDECEEVGAEKVEMNLHMKTRTFSYISKTFDYLSLY